MNSRIRITHDLVALLLTAAVAGIIVTYPLFDYDLYWHLANGREMLARGEILNQEIFSYTRAGTFFSNHEWLAQVILFFVYDQWGPIGLNVFKIVISVAVAVLSFLTCRALGASPAASGTIASIAILVGIYRYNVRPELFSLLFVSALLWILSGYRVGALSARALYAIPAIMLLWDWLHGAVFGAVILCAFFAGEIAKRLFSTRIAHLSGARPLPPEMLRSILIVLGITIVVMVLNPYGLRSYGIFFEFVGDNSLVPEVNEFQPPTWDNYATYFVALGMCALVLLVRFRFVDVTSLLVAAPFIYLSLRYSRATGVSALALAPLVAGTLGGGFSKAWSTRANTLVPKIVLGAVVAGATTYVGYAKFLRTDWNYTFGISELEDFSPVGATRFVVENRLAGNLYNSGNVGAYLSFHITPARKIFQYNHHTVFGNTVRFLQNPRELDQWNINYGIVSLPNEMKILFPRAEWARVYVEPSAAVVVRRSEANRDLISRFELRYFHPNLPREKLFAMARDPGARDRLLVEMADYLRYRRDEAVCGVLASLLTESSLQRISMADARKYLLDGPVQNDCLGSPTSTQSAGRH